MRFMGLSSLGPLLDKTAEGDETAQERQSDDYDVGDREKIRQELMIGHLLRLLVSGPNHGWPGHTLPTLATDLHTKGLLPKWLGWMLMQKPSIFDRAFDRLFYKVQMQATTLHIKRSIFL